MDHRFAVGMFGKADGSAVGEDTLGGQPTTNAVGEDELPHSGFGVHDGLIDHHNGVVFGIGDAVEKEWGGGRRMEVQRRIGGRALPMECRTWQFLPGLSQRDAIGQEEAGGEGKFV